ncbi:MAG: AMP-binding protein, partial [Myxococcaceae bacterium]|nr:AMP-binding protein [Myxococcaceae bacterium]
GDVVEDAAPVGIEAVVRLLACLAGGLVWRPLKEPSAPPRAGAFRLDGNGQLSGGPAQRGGAGGPSGVLLDSSGTEGPPRSILLGQAALCWQLEAHRLVLELAPHDVRVLTLPWTHAFGLVLDLLLGLVSQQTLVVAPLRGAWSPRALAARLAEADATWWCTVPRILELVVDAAPPGVSGPRRVLVGGAPVSARLRQGAQAWVGASGHLHVGYGMTEAGPGLAIDGRALPGIECRLDDGRLAVRTPAWCGAPSPDGWHDTGDVASLDAAGRLEVAGRASRRVKSPDATWLSLDALEAELATRPGVKAATIHQAGAGWAVCVLTDAGLTSMPGLTGFLERRLGAGVQLRVEPASPTLLAALAATSAKSISAALARWVSPPPPSSAPLPAR